MPNGGDDSRLVRMALALPLLLLLLAVVALTMFCGELLERAATGQPAELGLGAIYLLAGTFLFASAVMVAVQSLRVAARVSGPEHRLRLAMQRIRSGDVGFRVNLRRGDLLGELAQECNALLDWLNQNPPGAVRTGGDLVELPVPAADDLAADEAGAESLESGVAP
ncbi:MAG: hypothetical protein H6838_12205 [Planctomycetes bacterium]|nr:hypothetical protein [Planctomycetota bacterium]